MDKGGCFDGDDRSGEEAIDAQVLLRTAEDLRAEQEFHKRYSNHDIDFICNGAGLIVSRSVCGKREHALLIFFQLHQPFPLQVIQYLSRCVGVTVRMISGYHGLNSE